jgi:hypothetical protein
LLFATLVVNAQNKKDSTITLVTDFKLRHYLNISRVVRPIPEIVPTVDALLKNYFSQFSR